MSWDVNLFWWSFIGYTISCVLYLNYLAIEKKRIGYAAFGFMAIAFIFQTAAIILRVLHLKRVPLSDIYEYINILGWLAAFLGLIFILKYKQQIIGAFICPIIFMLMIACSLLPKEASMQLVPALQSYWLPIHVSLAVLGEAGFAVAFTASVMYLIKWSFLNDSNFAKRLPELEKLDLISCIAIKIAYPLFTIGALFAGALWAKQAWGSFWSWDPKETCALIVWFIYSAYLFTRYVFKWNNTKCAILSIIGFICAMFTLFSSLFLTGMHSYVGG